VTQRKLAGLLDLPNLQQLLDGFVETFGLSAAIMDADGGMVARSGWVDACTRFHRTRPPMEARCHASNDELTAEIRRTGKMGALRCGNGLWDYAWPLVADGRYLGSLWAGQFLTEPPDEPWFRSEARRAALDEEEYLRSVRQVPVFTPERVASLVSVFGLLAHMLSALTQERLGELSALSHLETSEMRYAALAEALPDAVYILARDGSVLYANGAAATLLGRPAHELVGRQQDELFARTQYRHKLAIDRVFETAQPIVRRQLREAMASGEVWIDVVLTPLKDGDGNVVAVMGISRDITDRVAAEETLLKSELKYRTLVENTEDSIVRWGRALELLHANRAALTLLGLSADAVMGRQASDVLSASCWVCMLEPFVREVLSTKELRRGQIEVRRDGVSLYLDYHLVPEIGEAGEVETVLGVARDITEMRRTQAAMVQAERLAAVGTLASGVAHEYNNIHTVVLGHLEVLARGEHLSAADRELIETIRAAVLRASGVTQNILTFAHAPRSERRPTSLSAIAEGAVRFVASAFASDAISVEMRLDGAPEVTVDPGQISQVVMNLLINARDALTGSTERKIVLESGATDGYVELTIRDTGCGIPEEDLGKIFLPFFTTKGEHARPGSPLSAVRGTGLGLSVSSTLLELNGGRMLVESHVGRGTAVTIRFPRESA
jgi:two-component system, cell cycle sensor histidine kinase and response regulator CckA